MARFDAVLFDLDGTLLDSVALILESYRHTLAAHDLPPRGDEEILRGLGTPLEAQFRRWVDDDALVRALTDAYIAHNLAVHDGLVKPYPGISEIIRALDDGGTPLAIVTSKRRAGTAQGLRALGLESAFSHLVCADDVEHPKPDPEPVRRALALLDVPPERAAFVGDATHDVEAGRAAGVVTIAVTWGAGTEDALRASGPDHLVHDAAALAAALGV